MSITVFSSVPAFAGELSLGRRSTGTSTTAFFDALPGKANLYKGSEGMEQVFYVRPVGVTKDSIEELMEKNAKRPVMFEVNLKVDPTDEAFVSACNKFDDGFVLPAAFANKDSLFPSKSQYMTSLDVLRPMYVKGRFLIPGGTSSLGNKYSDQIKLRVLGNWAPYVSEIFMRPPTGKAKWASVDKLAWLPRDPAVDPLGPTDTRFFLWVRKDEATGKDVYTDKVNVGGAQYSGVYRMVGPEDCKPGCKITPVFSFANLYVNDSFGVSVNARALYIKPKAEAMEERSARTPFMASTMPVLDDVQME